MRILRYIFYRLYQLMNSAGNADVADYFAIMLMSVLIGLNTFTLLSIVYVIFGVSPDISKAPKLFSVLYFLGLLVFFYFLFVRKDGLTEIVKKCEHETPKKKIIGNILTIGYILISICLLMLSSYLMMLKNRGWI